MPILSQKPAAAASRNLLQELCIYTESERSGSHLELNLTAEGGDLNFQDIYSSLSP